MAVISVRLNAEEEKMISILSSHFDEEKSSLIKHSLKEMYEDFIDREVINSFERKSRVKYVSADEILKSI